MSINSTPSVSTDAGGTSSLGRGGDSGPLHVVTNASSGPGQSTLSDISAASMMEHESRKNEAHAKRKNKIDGFGAIVIWRCGGSGIVVSEITARRVDNSYLRSP
mmetsp:Transcript_50437/g.107423  ORF Transcript_50437/g.107423 Transcript_50437/m.107423 type:complete len:104 (+) Transcript_50437:657-968(+)